MKPMLSREEAEAWANRIIEHRTTVGDLMILMEIMASCKIERWADEIIKSGRRREAQEKEES